MEAPEAAPSTSVVEESSPHTASVVWVRPKTGSEPTINPSGVEATMYASSFSRVNVERKLPVNITVMLFPVFPLKGCGITHWA